MRIVAGRHRGRRLLAPPGETVRPTSDRAREALFNILSHGQLAAEGIPFAGAAVLDAFAVTGALGLEALSRGAGEAAFIEQDREALATLRRNIVMLGEGDRARIVPGDATRPPRAPSAYALAFLDPPYRSGLAAAALTALDAAGWFTPDALAVVELAAREHLAPPAGFNLVDERVYGAARLLFLRPRPSQPQQRKNHRWGQQVGEQNRAGIPRREIAGGDDVADVADAGPDQETCQHQVGREPRLEGAESRVHSSKADPEIGDPDLELERARLPPDRLRHSCWKDNVAERSP